jgi:hypothetical protein
MAGTPAERANEAARSSKIRNSLRESSQMVSNDDDHPEQPTDQPVDPLLADAFGKLWENTVSREMFGTFLENMEKAGHERENVAWDMLIWAINTLYKEKDTVVEELNGQIQLMDEDVVNAQKERAEAQAQLEEQRGIVRALVAAGVGPRQTSPDPAATKNSKKFPDPTPWEKGMPSEWKQWKVGLWAKLKRNADWFPTEDARKDYFMKVVTGESWDIAEPQYLDDTTTVEDIVKALDYRWADPMEKETARNDYQTYLQLNKPFAEFIAKFRILARTAEVPEDIQVSDLRAKINLELQDQVAHYRPKDLPDFIDYLQHVARNVEQIKQQRQRIQARRRGGGAAGAVGRPTMPSSPAQSNQPSQPTQPPMIPPDHPEMVCLNCEKKGHRFARCPEPPQPGREGRIAAMRKRFEIKKNAENTIKAVEAVELDNGEPGKDDP